MVETNKINPESTMLQQSEGMWHKYVGLLLHKLAPEGVTITMADLEAFGFDERNVVLVHGHYDFFELKLVTAADAERLVAYDKQQQHGHG